MRHGDVLIWGLPFWSVALGMAVRRWWVLWLPAAVSVAWAAWGLRQVKPNDVGWMSGDVEVTAALALVMGLLAAASGVAIGRALRSRSGARQRGTRCLAPSSRD
jgi:hypothetical protein